MNKRYQVFLSSTYVDLKEEREEILRILLKLNCFPAGMELFPATDEKQFDYIKKEIDNSDYYLLIIAGRYGSLTPEGISYTEKEFLYALEKKIPVIAFIHKDINNIPLGKVDVDENIRKKLEEFKKKVETNRLVKYWADATSLYSEVSITLARMINECPRIGWVRGDEKTQIVDDEKIICLQREIDKLKEENKHYIKLFGGEIEGVDKDFELRVVIVKEDFYESKELIDSNISLNWSEWYNKIVSNIKTRPFEYIDEHIEDVLCEIFYINEPNISVKGIKEIVMYFQNQFVALGFIKVKQTQFEHKWELTQKGEKYYALLNCKKS